MPGMRHAGTPAQARILAKKAEQEARQKVKLEEEQYQDRINILQNELHELGIGKRTLLSKALARSLVDFLYKDD